MSYYAKKKARSKIKNSHNKSSKNNQKIEISFNKEEQSLIINSSSSFYSKGKTAREECLDLKLYEEYDNLNNKELDNFNKGKHLVLRAIIKMVEFDPIKADKKIEMTDQDRAYWKDLENDIKMAGNILNDHGGMIAMKDDRIWDFIPPRLYQDFNMHWNGIGEWKA